MENYPGSCRPDLKETFFFTIIFEPQHFMVKRSYIGVTPTFAPPAANRAQGTAATGQKTALWAYF